MKKSRGALSALTGEERIRILGHIGIEPPVDDLFGRLLSVVEHLPHNWKHKDTTLRPPDVNDKTFQFPVINQNKLFIRQCYHDLYDIVIKTPVLHTKPIRILLTGTPGIGKSTFLIYFIIRYLYESKNPAATFKNDESSVTSTQMRDVLIF